jgi:hypothetical protein
VAQAKLDDGRHGDFISHGFVEIVGMLKALDVTIDVYHKTDD